MSKRPAENDGSPGGQPPIKKVQFEPMRIGPISTLEEMDMKVLQFQNKKLALRLEQRHRAEAELRQRIEQLEKRQTQDDAVLNVVNRYWNQLNEDIRLLLQRFDAETADESENKNENEATTSFLMQLSTWDKEELDEKLANRVQVSKRAVAKVIQAFDRLMQRNEKITLALKGDLDGVSTDEPPPMDETVRQVNIELQAENRNLQALNTSLHEKYHTISLKMAELQEQGTGKETEAAELRNQIDDLQYELQKVTQRNDKLETSLADAIEQLKTYQQLHAQADDKAQDKKPVNVVTNSVSTKKMEDLQKELEEQRELANNRLQELDRLHMQHRDALKEVEKLKMDIRQLPESIVVETTEYKCLQSQFSVLYNESMQLKTQLDEARQQLQSSKNTHLRQIEMMESDELAAQKKLRTEVISLEDLLAQLRKEYEMLRIEFEQNLAANEQTGPINREMRHLITSLQNHNQQLKGEVHRYKRKYKDTNAELPKLKREIEELTTQLEQQAAAEKQECASSESSVKEEDLGVAMGAGGNPAMPSNMAASGDMASVKEEGNAPFKKEVSGEEHENTAQGEENELENDSEKSLMSPSKQEKDVKPNVAALAQNTSQNPAQPGTAVPAAAGAAAGPAAGAPAGAAGGQAQANAAPADGVKREVKTEPGKEQHRSKDAKGQESELVRDLRAQLKKALNDQKEMKLLLDMYKGVSKEQRDKVQLMAAEKKNRAELEDLRQQIKKIQESKREDRKKLADEDAMRKIRQLEDQAYQLQKQLATHKQEEEALLNEMEVTGQAFEDMQEQNSRLIQQLREKDDANFKLMTERIKSNQLQKLAREEKDVLKEQVMTMTTQVEATNLVVRKLEEKERILQNSLATVEKELALRQQAMEVNKRKAIESAQSAADLKLHLEKYHAQMKEAQQVVTEKTSSLEAEAYKTKRLQEELGQLRRKAERMKKIELAGTLDEVMLEEIREYKETLTCPSCKVKRKDAVLTKCFHVFCWDCLRTRYETRQRKCPKCNAAFGANDYHRLYLST